jgi:hypothetical protein
VETLSKKDNEGQKIPLSLAGRGLGVRVIKLFCIERPVEFFESKGVKSSFEDDLNVSYTGRKEKYRILCG